jgi:hypothetical protein
MNTSKVGGINEIATALGVPANRLSKLKQAGDFLDPIGTVSGREAYDMRQAERWAKTHLTGETKGATATATRTRTARTGMAPGRRSRTR